jgi:hypothetical protein
MSGLRRAGGLRHGKRRGDVLVHRAAADLADPGEGKRRPLLLPQLSGKNDPRQFGTNHAEASVRLE